MASASTRGGKRPCTSDPSVRFQLGLEKATGSHGNPFVSHESIRRRTGARGRRAAQLPEEECREADQLIADFERRYREDLPGTPPPLSRPAAHYGAVVLYRACQFLVFREVDAGHHPPRAERRSRPSALPLRALQRGFDSPLLAGRGEAGPRQICGRSSGERTALPGEPLASVVCRDGGGQRTGPSIRLSTTRAC